MACSAKSMSMSPLSPFRVSASCARTLCAHDEIALLRIVMTGSPPACAASSTYSRQIVRTQAARSVVRLAIVVLKGTPERSSGAFIS